MSLSEVRDQLKKFDLNPNDRELQVCLDFIERKQRHPSMKRDYHFYRNNCAHVAYFALSVLLGESALKHARNVPRLKPQSLIRALHTAYPEAQIQRARWSNATNSYQIHTGTSFVKQGYRPFIVLGSVLTGVLTLGHLIAS